MPVDLSVLDELREDVFDLSPRQRRRIEFLQELVQVGAAPLRFLDRTQNIFFADFSALVCFLRPAISISLLTSPDEEHRFENLAEMAELADALDSGSSPRKGVEVRVLFSALTQSAG